MSNLTDYPPTISADGVIKYWSFIALSWKTSSTIPHSEWQMMSGDYRTAVENLTEDFVRALPGDDEPILIPIPPPTRNNMKLSEILDPVEKLSCALKELIHELKKTNQYLAIVKGLDKAEGILNPNETVKVRLIGGVGDGRIIYMTCREDGTPYPFLEIADQNFKPIRYETKETTTGWIGQLA